MIRKFVFPAVLLAHSCSLAADPAPVWERGPVSGDPLFFVKAEGAAAATASLLHIPEAAPVIRSATLEITFEAGRDFEWKPGTSDLTLPQGSRIPFKTAAELHPAPGSPHSYNGYRDGKAWMLFGEGRYFHDLQCVADYATSEAPVVAAPAAAPQDQLAASRRKLKAGGAFTLVTLGDSISTGANASGPSGVAPHQPGYPDLVAKGLTSRFSVTVSTKNLSVGGMDSAWGLKQCAAVIAEKPDMVILAFGMNDASGHRKPDEFARIIRETASAIRAAVPECDVVLVSPMTANAEWIHAAPDLYPAHAAALTKLTGPGIALADVTATWTAVASRKPYLCLSGNGLNHPNDFGHRLYADIILATIGGK